jgi:hypothetical protein
MIAKGALPASKFGRDWCIPADDVERCRRQRRQGGRPWSAERAERFLRAVDAGEVGISELEASAHKLRSRPPTDSLAGRWLDLNAAGDPEADRVAHTLLRRFCGTWPIATLVDSIGSEDRLDWTVIRAWADHVNRYPASLPGSIEQMPAASGSDRIDNLLAAIVEREADLACIPRPTWTVDVRPLDEPWRANGTPRMQDIEHQHAPVQFLDRGIWLGEANVWRRR